MLPTHNSPHHHKHSQKRTWVNLCVLGALAVVTLKSDFSCLYFKQSVVSQGAKILDAVTDVLPILQTSDEGTAASSEEDNGSIKPKPSKQNGGGYAPKFAVLLTCSEGFFLMWQNWLEHFRRLQIPNLPVHLFAEDNQTYYRCLNQTNELQNFKNGTSNFHVDLTCLSWNHVFPPDTMENSIGTLGYRKSGYKTMMSHRPAIVQRQLELGWDVIFSDVDALWIKNPLPYFEGDFTDPENPSPNKEEIHVWGQKDGEKNFGKNGRHDFLCPGFMIFKSCPTTIALIDKWRRDLEGQDRRNQMAFNGLLWGAVETGVAYEDGDEVFIPVPKTLPVENFVGYSLYRDMTEQERSNVVVLHNNGGQAGYDSKLNRFKDHGLWIVDGDKIERDHKKPKNPKRQKKS